jgi:hypothetical protein
MDSGFWVHVPGCSPPDGRYHRALTRGGFDAHGRFLIVSADLVCGMCSFARPLDAAAAGVDRSGEMG